MHSFCHVFFLACDLAQRSPAEIMLCLVSFCFKMVQLWLINRGVLAWAIQNLTSNQRLLGVRFVSISLSWRSSRRERGCTAPTTQLGLALRGCTLRSSRGCYASSRTGRERDAADHVDDHLAEVEDVHRGTHIWTKAISTVAWDGGQQILDAGSTVDASLAFGCGLNERLEPSVV